MADEQQRQQDQQDFSRVSTKSPCGFMENTCDGRCLDGLHKNEAEVARAAAAVVGSSPELVMIDDAQSKEDKLSLGEGKPERSLYKEKRIEIASCSQAAKSSEEITAQLESAAAMNDSPNHSLAISKSASSLVSSSSSVGSLEATAMSVSAMNDSNNAPPPTKKSRCLFCKKRVGLLGFNCRCGGLYCGEHRYDSAHNCSFDYKTMEREEIRKNNPVIVSEKIQRI